MTSTIQNIPLKSLALWDGNVRKTEGSDTGLAELAASIASVGIINPLTVIPKGKKHLVVAGGRRLAALKLLQGKGDITESYAVPVTVTDENSATEISIAENVIREDMHPADEFEAFLKLSKQGIPNEDIAAKFGVTPAVVTKRLRLANVSPKIMAAYRKDEIDLACVMAYAVTDDVKRQNKVFKSLDGYRGQEPDSIRAALTEGEIDAGDKRVRFVTLQAYEQAGGKTRRDLFASEDDESGIYILDLPLLEELAATKLEAAADALRAEGWKWVEVRNEFGWDVRSKFKQLREEPLPLADDLQQEIDRLTEEYNALYDLEGEFTDEQSARIDEIDARIAEIENAQGTTWPEGTVEFAGAVLTLDHDGDLDIIRGLVRPEDVKNLPKPKTSGDDGEEPSRKTVHDKSALPAKLIEQLTRHRTAALAAELMQRPDIGLAVVAYNLASPLFAEYARQSCVHISISQRSHDAVAGSPAAETLESRRILWGDTLPGTPDALWAWCLQQDQGVLIDLITFCAAWAVDAVVKKRGPLDSKTDMAHAEALASELRLDMTKWFTPTAANYFAHISKAQILEALSETGKGIAPAWNKAKKGELASIAETAIAGTGWLPKPLRAADESSAQEVSKAA